MRRERLFKIKANGTEMTLSMSGWARLAGVSRQAMAKRVKEAGTDKKALRDALLGRSKQGQRNDLRK